MTSDFEKLSDPSPIIRDGCRSFRRTERARRPALSLTAGYRGEPVSAGTDRLRAHVMIVAAKLRKSRHFHENSAITLSIFSLRCLSVSRVGDSEDSHA